MLMEMQLRSSIVFIEGLKIIIEVCFLENFLKFKISPPTGADLEYFPMRRA